jgi:hypothetical protein
VSGFKLFSTHCLSALTVDKFFIYLNYCLHIGDSTKKERTRRYTSISLLMCFYFLGSLTVANSLDFESIVSYRLRIVARDNGIPSLSSTATIVVNVQNVNDNVPRFDQKRYEVLLSEDVPPGTVVVQLSAVDLDDPKGQQRINSLSIS